MRGDRRGYDGALDGAATALAGWHGRGIGTCDAAVTPAYRRRVWVADCDHYAHRDCEVQIFSPVDESETDFPAAIDLVYVKPQRFPEVVRALGATVQDGTGVVPKKFFDCFEGEDDCAGVYAFEGEYRGGAQRTSQRPGAVTQAPHRHRGTSCTCWWRTNFAGTNSYTKLVCLGPSARDPYPFELELLAALDGHGLDPSNGFRLRVADGPVRPLEGNDPDTSSSLTRETDAMARVHVAQNLPSEDGYAPSVSLGLLSVIEAKTLRLTEAFVGFTYKAPSDRRHLGMSFAGAPELRTASQVRGVAAGCSTARGRAEPDQ